MTKLTSVQSIILIVMIQIGVGILSLPSVLSSEVYGLGWVSVIISGIFIQLIVFLYYFALKNVTAHNLFEFLEEITGKLIARFIAVVFIVYFIGAASSILRNFVEVLHIWIYPKTPSIVLVVMMWIPITYLATSKIASIARLSQFFFIGVLLLLILLLWHFQKFNFNYLRPESDVQLVPILKGSWQASLSLIGFELILFFHFFLKKREQILKVLTISNWITIAIYVYIVVITAVLFSPEKLKKIIWPTLSLYKLIEFKFIQRLEYVIVLMWLPLIIITTGAYLWGGFKSAKFLFAFKRKFYPYIISVLILFFALIPQTHPQIIKFADYIGYFGIFLSIILPLFILLMKNIGRKDKV